METIPVVPLVLPMLDSPALKPDGPAIVTAFPFWLSVMLLPPANVRVPLDTSERVPVVFPANVISIKFCVCTVCVKALIVMELAFWLSVILFPPANNAVPDDIDAVVPDVLPAAITAIGIVGPDIVIVAEPRFDDSDNVI